MDIPIDLLFKVAKNPENAMRTLAPYIAPRVVEHVVKNYVPRELQDVARRTANAYTGQRDSFLESLHEREAGIYPIVGAGGQGKTSFAFALAEHIERDTYAVNIPRGILPSWAQSVPIGDVGDLAPGSVVILDDAGQVASSRDYTSEGARDLESLLQVVRHVGLVFIITTTASNLVHNSLLDANAFFFKTPSIFRRAAERPEIREFIEMAAEAFAALSTHERKRHVFAVSDDPTFAGMISYDLPAGWTDRLSKNKRSRPDIGDIIEGEVTYLDD